MIQGTLSPPTEKPQGIRSGNAKYQFIIENHAHWVPLNLMNFTPDSIVVLDKSIPFDGFFEHEGRTIVRSLRNSFPFFYIKNEFCGGSFGGFLEK